MPRIGFHIGNPIICGGIIVPFEYVKRLKERGYEAYIIANNSNEELERFYGINHSNISILDNFTDEDVIIAVRWEQTQDLEKYKGIKIQFVQGDDTIYYKNHSDLPRLIKARNNPNWELIGVSKFCLKNWGRGTVIPNGVSERFFNHIGLERNIPCLVEGNDEPNKNIPYAIEQARKFSDDITWMGRETHERGVKTITNPPQREIPFIYQRAEHFFKYSYSEGFSLPILEAMASGCIVHTKDMGGNDFCIDGFNCWMNSYDESQNKFIIQNAKQTAQDYSWDRSIDNLTQYLEVLNLNKS